MANFNFNKVILGGSVAKYAPLFKLVPMEALLNASERFMRYKYHRRTNVHFFESGFTTSRRILQ